MSAAAATLLGFAYGEHIEGPQERSLGYRLLVPAEPLSWSAEVESLARGLQAVPYPEHWPPTDLFCSILLADGKRLVAMVRYGLVDHTPSRRRGGLEMIGAIAPGNLGVTSALAIYRWLCQRRQNTEDLRSLGGEQPLSDVLSAAPPATQVMSEPSPVLPIRLWQEGTLLFAATSPSDANRRLGLLEQGAHDAWQWLPLVGADFPLASYAQRGPLIAWTPHLAGVALKLDRKPAEPADQRQRGRPILLPLLLTILLLLLTANLWATLAMYQRLGGLMPATSSAPR